MTQSEALYCGFESLEAAVEHRSKAGGWIFHSSEGDVLWFSLFAFTPSSILTHPATAGMSGKLV